jgi:hypothetical protein
LQDRLLKEYRVITQSGYDTPDQDD